MANKTVYPYGTNGSLPASVGIINDMTTGGADKALSAEQGKIIGGKIEVYDDMVDDLYGVEREIEETVDFSSASLFKISMDAGTFYYRTTSVNYRAYLIPIPEGSERLVLKTKASTACNVFIARTEVPVGDHTGATIASNYMATGCDGYTPNHDSVYRMYIIDTEVEILLSKTAKFIYIQKNFNDTSVDQTPASLVFYGTVRKDGRLDTMGGGSNGVFDGLSLVRGTIDENGNIVPDNTHLVSNPIPISAGYFLRANTPDYKIARVVLYDNSGKMVNDKYFTPIGTSINKTSRFSRTVCLEGYFVRFLIERMDGETVTPEDPAVTHFVLFNDRRLHRVIPDNPKFNLFHERLKAMTNVVWKALGKVAAPTLYNTTYFDAGATHIGIPYSELGEYSKYVGLDVSLRTFLTALLNPRSVMYTENVSAESSASKYGVVYHNYEGAAGAYYGTVCSGLTAYALGLKVVITSALYGKGRISGETVIAKGDSNNKYYKKENDSWVVCTAEDILALVQPMDLVVSPGHVSMISDIYVDEYGDRKFITWCEEGRAEVCVAKSMPLTTDNFISKLDGYTADEEGWQLCRYSNWDNLVPVPGDRETIPMAWYEYPKHLTIDPDICTYAGDYVVFQIGDAADTLNNNKAFLNIHRNGDKYDTLQIFAEDADESTDTPVATVDISSNSGTFIYNSTNIFSDDASDKDDWIVVDLKQLPTALTHGKYKARVIKGGGTAASGFTHFQMVDVNFTITGTSLSDMVCNYTSEEGTPIYIRRERRDGLGAWSGSASYQREIPEGETSCTNPRNWAISSTNRYIKVIVKADYGTAVKRIDAYAQFNS